MAFTLIAPTPPAAKKPMVTCERPRDGLLGDQVLFVQVLRVVLLVEMAEAEFAEMLATLVTAVPRGVGAA